MPEELIDVLDANGIKTGQVATREEVHRKGLWHRIAVVAVLDDRHRVLLQQRSNNKQTNPGKWDIAAAGHVDAGEDSPTTAKREVEEGVGITVVGNLQFILTYSKESKYEWRNEEMCDRQVFDCYLLRVPEIKLETLKLQDSEVQAAKVCTLSEFKLMLDSGEMVNRQPLYDELVKVMEKK